MSNANDDIKNKLGAEYDLYSSLKDSFQGFDKEGNAVFKDDAGDVTSFNKKDFAKMNEQLKSDFGEKSYEETFNEAQFKDLEKQGNKFQGFAGDNAIFRNEKGDLENFGNQGGFASFLKKQQPNATFDISKQGKSQRTKDQYSAAADFLANKEVVKQKTGSGFTGYNPQAALQSLGGGMMNPQPELKTSVNPNIAKANTPGGTFQNFKAKQTKKPTALSQESEAETEQKSPSLGAMAKQMAMAKAKEAGQQFLGQKKEQAQNMATNALSNVTGLSTQMITNPQDAARQAAINKAAGVTGFSADAIMNPEQAAKNAAMDKLTSTTGINASLLQGNIADNVQNLATDRAKTAGMDYLKANDPTGMSQYAGLINGNVVDNAKQFAMDKAKATGMDFLKQNDPTGGALSQYAQYADLLKGDVVGNAKNLAEQRLKEEAMKKIATMVPGGAYASSALDAGKSAKKILSGEGSSEDKGRAAAQAAARATAAYLTGGLATEQNMEMGNALTNRGFATAEKNVGSDLKPTVDAARQYANVGQTLGKGTSKLALDAIGNTGASQGRALSDASKAVKAITSGNIEEGLKGLGKGAANLALQTFLKNPETIAKGIGNLGKEAVAKAANAAKAALNAINPFCFAPDTMILMANGKYKKIKQIKLGEEVMLGGKVTAIGQSTSDDMYLYDGVEVSGGHTLYEDGKWIRTKDSKYAVKMDIEEALVYPMDTENHLIVTKGQIWADMSEVDNTYDKTDTDILAQLNSQTEANKRLDLFLKLYFKRK
jgi:hypothetical protein